MEKFLPQSKFLGKFSSSNLTQKEKKRARVILLSLFGISLGLVGLAIVYRKLPQWWQKFGDSGPIVSRRFIGRPTPNPTPVLEEERKVIEELIKPLRGKYGIYFQDLQNNLVLTFLAQEKMTAASLIKLPVILTLYREAEAGRIDLETVYKLKEEDRRGGAGSLQYKPAGYEITYRQLAELMGKQSDNTAYHIITKILGEEKVQNTIDSLGMKDTSFAENMTTPQDIGIFLERLYRGKVVSEKSREEILNFLTDTIWEDRIPAGIPKGIRVAHKIGTEVGVISDAGIVFSSKPFILVIMTQNANEIEAKKILPQIARKFYEIQEGLVLKP